MKGTVIFLFILSIVATFLIGINVGKKIEKSFLSSNQPTTNDQKPTTSPSPTIFLTPTTISTPSATKSPKKTTGTSTYTDKSCGFTFSYPGTFLQTKNENGQSVIFTDPDDDTQAIAIVCADKIPRPPLSADKIEPVTVDRVSGLLYHDKNPNGTLRDEVIVKHPTKNHEIIIAGFGDTFQKALSSFKFLR